MTFVEQLRKLRDAAGLTQEQMAERHQSVDDSRL
jgi:transcriptional regulator with XRE-family HTH domain